MRTSTVLAGLAAAVAPLASAHTVLTTVFVNDENQGDGTGIRMPTDGSTSTSPIIDMYSNDMICGKFYPLLREPKRQTLTPKQAEMASRRSATPSPPPPAPR